MRGVCRLDFVLAEGGSRGLEGVPVGLLGFGVGLLDIHASVLEFLPHSFCLVSEGFHLLHQPSDLFMKHVEIRRGRGRGLHFHIAELASQVAGRFIHRRFGRGEKSVCVPVLTGLDSVDYRRCLCELANCHGGLWHGLRRLKSRWI